MRNNTQDQTLKKNYIQKYQFLVKEYEQVKLKKHPQFKFVKDFYKHHGTCPQTFLKYYGRYKQDDKVESLLPQKRGPKWKSRRTCPEIEKQVIELRDKGLNRYEITRILKPKLGAKTPSPSCVYQVCKRHGKNRLNQPMKEEKRRIIKTRAGELGHIDCHHLSADLIGSESQRRYLVCVIDSYSRIAWAEIVNDITSLTVMFAAMRCFNWINSRYGIEFEELLSDNGPEFGPKGSKNKHKHPFERMLTEVGIKHRYTRPYRPQTNGKVERFWRTLNEDLINNTHFETINDFEKELMEYLLYYNQERPHQGIKSQAPVEILKPIPSTNE
ncbi:MAG: integrase core domain-containing protein [Arenicellales bacterium]